MVRSIQARGGDTAGFFSSVYLELNAQFLIEVFQLKVIGRLVIG